MNPLLRLYSYRVWLAKPKRFLQYYDLPENEYIGIDRGRMEYGNVRFWREDDAKKVAKKWLAERTKLGLPLEDMLIIFYIHDIEDRWREVTRKKI